MKTASVIGALAYGIEILLSGSRNLKKKINKFDESLDQRICDSLYRMDVRHKELENLISESRLGALLYINCTIRYTQSALSPNRIHKRHFLHLTTDSHPSSLPI